MHQTTTRKSHYRSISNLVHSQKFWSWVNSVKHHCVYLPPLQMENSTVINDHTKANMFNKYLSGGIRELFIFLIPYHSVSLLYTK